MTCMLVCDYHMTHGELIAMPSDIAVEGALGDACTDNPSTCTAEFAECVSGICQCTGYYVMSLGMCSKSLIFAIEI